MKSPIQQQVHFIKEVALPSLTFQFEPHCGQCDIWLGGELAKEVASISRCKPRQSVLSFFKSFPCNTVSRQFMEYKWDEN